jgi:hypothetical protein
MRKHAGLPDRASLARVRLADPGKAGDRHARAGELRDDLQRGFYCLDLAPQIARMNALPLNWRQPAPIPAKQP